jgi:hypothetical protein
MFVDGDDSSTTDSRENGVAAMFDVFWNEIVDSFGEGGVWSALMGAWCRGGVGGLQTLTSS